MTYFQINLFYIDKKVATITAIHCVILTTTYISVMKLIIFANKDLLTLHAKNQIALLAFDHT